MSIQYPVKVTVMYASGRTERPVFKDGWTAHHAALSDAHKHGAVVGYIAHDKRGNLLATAGKAVT